MQEEIHEKLDQALVEYNKMLDQYQELRSQLGEALKNVSLFFAVSSSQ